MMDSWALSICCDDTLCVEDGTQGAPFPGPAEVYPGALGMGLVGLCMCVSVDLGTVSRDMNLACI